MGFFGSFLGEQEMLLRVAVLTAKPLKMVDFKNLRLSAIRKNFFQFIKINPSQTTFYQSISFLSGCG